MTAHNPNTLDNERQARLNAIYKALDAADITREAFFVPDCTAHTVNIPAALLIALCEVKARAGALPRSVLELALTNLLFNVHESLELVDAAQQIFNPMDLAVGKVDSPAATPRKKRTMSDQQKAALKAGRERAADAKRAKLKKDLGTLMVGKGRSGQTIPVGDSVITTTLHDVTAVDDMPPPPELVQLMSLDGGE